MALTLEWALGIASGIIMLLLGLYTRAVDLRRADQDARIKTLTDSVISLAKDIAEFPKIYAMKHDLNNAVADIKAAVGRMEEHQRAGFDRIYDKLDGKADKP